MSEEAKKIEELERECRILREAMRHVCSVSERHIVVMTMYKSDDGLQMSVTLPTRQGEEEYVEAQKIAEAFASVFDIGLGPFRKVGLGTDDAR